MKDSKLQNTIDIKFILLGEDYVGKSSLIAQYINNIFDENYLTTIASEKYEKYLKIKDKDIKLNIWDSVGQKVYRIVNKIFIKNCKIVLIVYNITDWSQFEELNYWINTVKEENKDKEVIIGIAVNKSDLFEQKVVDTEEGKKFADENNCLFFETSALDYESTENAFLKLVEKYIDLEEEKEKDELFLSKILINKNEKREKRIYDNGDIFEGILKKGKEKDKEIMKYKNGNKYSGNFKNDLKEGYGIMKYNNGDIFDGNFKNDKKEGKGILINSQGKYECNWENNEINGYGKIYYNNKYIFEGNFKNGKKEGKGIILNDKGEKLEINFKNDIIVGNGILYLNNGRIINGIFNNNYIPIEGKIIFKNGEIYEGKLNKNGEREGKGKMNYNNGYYYEGNWINDIRNGKGILYKNEEDYNIIINNNEINNLFKCKDDFYIGEYKNNMKEGKGIMNNNKILNYKIIYKGEFKEDKMEGIGKLYFENGSIFEGNWKKNNINKSKEGILYINNLIKIKKNLNKNEWIKLIEKDFIKYYGNKNIMVPGKINIK